MREIKFRAWDNDRKRYDYNNHLVIQLDGMSHNLQNGESDIYTIEQFTGLHDKNGKEIYEGDILLFKNFHEGWNPKLEINKWDAICVVEWERERSSFSLTEACGNRFGFYRDSWFYYEKEIIGNIHENPELYK